MTALRFCLIPSTLALLAAPLSAQCLTWTPQFSSAATLGSVSSFHLDDSGPMPRLLVAGALTSVAGVDVNHIAEYDGQSWQPVGPGVDFIPEAVTSHGVGATREIYLGGMDRLQRWDGTSWSNVDFLSGTIRAMAFYDDGSGPALYVAGDELRSFTVGPSLLLRYDGAWTSIADDNATGNPFLADLVVHDDGTGPGLYVGGRFSGLGGVAGENLLRYDASGFRQAGAGDLPPITSGFQGVGALASSERAGQQVLHVGLGGLVQSAQGPSTWLIEGPGSWVGLDVTESIFDLTVERRPSASDVVWALTKDGLTALDGTIQQTVPFPPPNIGFQQDLAWFPGPTGPRIWVGGLLQFFQGSALAFWDGSEWALPGVPGSGPPFRVDQIIQHDFGAGPELVVLTANFGDRPIFRTEAGGWTELLRGGLSTEESLASHDGSLYVASRPSPVIRYDGPGSWTPIDMGTGSFRETRVVTSLDLGNGPELFIGGRFTSLTQPGTSCIARLEGQQFVDVGGGVNGTVGFQTVDAIVAWDDGQGVDLYIGGGFLRVGGVAAQNVARWTGTVWEPLPGGPRNAFIGLNDDSVLEMVAGEVNGRRLLFASGVFDRLGTEPNAGLAAWDGSQWLNIDGAPQDPIRYIGDARGLAMHDPDGQGERLFVFGSFETPNGPEFHVGFWDGTSWQLAPGVDMNSTAFWLGYDLLSADLGDGRALYAAGNFDRLGGASADHVARLDAPCGRIVGEPFCTALLNSTGETATCRASGSASLSANDFVLHLENAPPGAFALFALGPNAIAPTPLGSGRLCLGGALERILPPGLTSATGGLTVPVDLNASYAAAAAPGVTLHAQAFFRDTAPGGGATFGTSDGLAVRFLP